MNNITLTHHLSREGKWRESNNRFRKEFTYKILRTLEYEGKEKVLVLETRNQENEDTVYLGEIRPKQQGEGLMFHPDRSHETPEFKQAVIDRTKNFKFNNK